MDCDGDTLLITARPLGPVCHAGTATCFGDEPVTGASAWAFWRNWAVSSRNALRPSPRKATRPGCLRGGPQRMAQKVGEEGVEVALAAVGQSDERLLAESADLLFHLMVLLRSRNLNLDGVVSELAARHAKRP